MGCFDTVFFDGVLYHWKSPFEHLEELKAALYAWGVDSRDAGRTGELLKRC